MLRHPLKPIYNQDSKILILGTMPSVKSRELNSYYAHPQNRFWKILEKMFNEKINDKEQFLLKNKIALWDVIASCDINGSSDSSIKNVIPNNISKIIKESNINMIFTTGKTAFKLYNKYIYPDVLIDAICLPSPSPANCKFSFEELLEQYRIIKKSL